MQPTVAPLEKYQTFCFTCSPEVTCYNACCRNLNQVLTPYDVLCLRQFLNMSSSDFLSRYTEASTGPATGLPVVSLRFSDADDLACPFVTDAGCRVYPARPASCRTYPLARGISRDRKTGRLRTLGIDSRAPLPGFCKRKTADRGSMGGQSANCRSQPNERQHAGADQPQEPVPAGPVEPFRKKMDIYGPLRPGRLSQ